MKKFEKLHNEILKMDLKKLEREIQLEIKQIDVEILRNDRSIYQRISK